MKQEILDSLENLTVLKSLLKSENVIDRYSGVAISVSGGADSDILVDIASKIDTGANIRYIFFNTGLEYRATFDQLDYLENKYGIKIERLKVKKPIPIAIKEKGQPFMNKFASEMITRLQSHNFKWEDKPLEELIKEYPHCLSALEWWCNNKPPSLRISQNKFLKEFMVKCPPQFKISGSCCKHAKKNPSKLFVKENDIQLMITGVRKAEGGARATAYKTCYNENEGNDKFYPILWYTNDDKIYYEKFADIEHSKCYTEYGLKRTGCAGCPFGRNFEFELEVIKEYEPRLYKAATNIFKDSYEYTREYKRFRKYMEIKTNPQMHISEFE